MTFEKRTSGLLGLRPCNQSGKNSEKRNKEVTCQVELSERLRIRSRLGMGGRGNIVKYYNDS